MSYTPRTDTKEQRDEEGGYRFVSAEFARELERENAKLRKALLKATGSLGLIIGGAGAQAIGHRENYENAKKVIKETFHD